MTAPKSLIQRHFRAFRRSLGIGRTRVVRSHGEFALQLIAYAGPLFAALAAPANLAAQTQMDQVSSSDARGRTTVLRGHVQQNTLESTVIEVNGKETRVASNAVRTIRLGDVPDAFTEGATLFTRGDYGNAAAKFQAVAGDSQEREVVRAEARLRAARALLKRGGIDDTAFKEAASQLERFLADHPGHRDLPTARALHALAQRLSGDLGAASATYSSLYKEISGGTPPTGYSAEVCLQAGLSSADCLLASGDADGARQLYAELSSAITSAIASLASEDPDRLPLSDLESEAQLGEGFCMLAAGKTTQARTFFEGQLNNAPKLGTQRYGARYGLGRVYFAEARYRDAAIEFAQVSAIEPTNRDRAAAALIGLVECAAKGSDPKAAADIERWLRTVREHYGETPSILRAKELAKGH